MPYYNEADLLRKSVEAVFKQSYKDWHLFLVDDGSKMGVRAYQIIDIPTDLAHNITFVYKRNGGVSTARNTAIDMILKDGTFDYVAYCDSDDVWQEQYLEKQVNTLTLTGEADMVYVTPQHRFVDGSVAIPYGIADYPAFPGLEKLMEGNCIFVSGVMHKVECLSIVGYFDHELNSIEDWDYWVRICKSNFKIHKNPHTTFVYTVKTNGNGSKSNKEVYERFYKKHQWLR